MGADPNPVTAHVRADSSSHLLTPAKTLARKKDVGATDVVRDGPGVAGLSAGGKNREK